MAYRAGTAYLAVSPSFRGFQTKAAAEAKKLRPIKVPVQYDYDNLVVGKPKPVRVPVAFDVRGGGFERKLQTQLRKALAALPEAEIGVATNAAEQKIKDLRAELTALSEKRIGVDLSAAQAIADAKRLREELARVAASSTDIQVHADTGEAAAELEAVEALANRLDRKRPDVKVDADTGAAHSKLTALQARLTAMAAGRTLIQVGIVAAPMAIPALAGLVGGGAALGGIAAGVVGGIGAAAAVGLNQLTKAKELQKQITQATEGRKSAISGVRSAEASLASASESAAHTQLQSARAIADAQRAVADARRNAARVARESARQVQAAQARLADTNDRVNDAEKALHEARRQAIKDLEELRDRIRDNAIEQESADLGLIAAKERLADAEANIYTSATDMRRARLEVAEAEDRVADARRQAADDAQKLAKAEKDGPGGSAGVKAAQEQLRQAKEDRNQARLELQHARVAAQEARADAARQVAAAERNLGRARVDAAYAQAQAHQQVADAQAGLAAAQADLAESERTRLGLLDKLTPAQERMLVALASLQRAWRGFLRLVDRPLGGAMVSAMGAMEKALPGLAIFLRPVLRSLRGVFDLLGNAAASKGAKSFARIFGVFSGKVIRDAGRGTRNLLAGLGSLLKAFMPLSTDMSGGLVKLTRRFRTWSAGLENSKGFQRFIGYVRKDGPLLLSTLKSIGAALIAVGVALAPLATKLLEGVKAFADWLAKTAEAHPTLIRIAGTIAVATAGFGLLAKILLPVIRLVSGVVRVVIFAIKWIRIIVFNLRILFMVLRLNPIGLVITAITLLVAGFILAYKKSATFRRIVDGALRAVKTAAVFVWDWLKKNWPKLFVILTGPFGLAVVLIAKNWKAIKDGTKLAVLWIVDKVLWMAEKMLGAMETAFGWAPKIGPKIKAALDEVKGFREGVNREMDAIRDEDVNVRLSTITIKNARKKNDRQLGRADVVGGRGPLPATAPRAAVGGAGILPHVKAPLGPVRTFARTTQAQARALGLSEAEALQDQLRERRAARIRGRASGAPAASGPFGRPVKNYGITATWMSYPGHTGIDLAAPTGTPVFSAGKGKVIASYDLPGSNPYNSTPYRSYGRVVEVQHQGFSTLYAHLSKRLARVGQTVARGALLGLVGMNGNATGPHLHFETRPGGHPVNPQPFMAARGLKFDRGGELPQGLTLAYHGPRKPDKVLTDAQWNDIHAAARAGDRGGPRVLEVYDVDNKLVGRMQVEARKVTTGQRHFNAAQSAAGMGGRG